MTPSNKRRYVKDEQWPNYKDGVFIQQNHILREFGEHKVRGNGRYGADDLSRTLQDGARI